MLVDSKARTQALDLISRFSTGRIAYAELESSWPSSEGDAALYAIGRGVFYAFHEDTSWITGKPRSFQQEEEAFLRRCAAFLRSQREYEWRGNPFSSSTAAKLQSIATLGIVQSLERQEKEALQAQGDVEVWPFLKRSEWLGELGDIGLAQET